MRIVRNKELCKTRKSKAKDSDLRAVTNVEITQEQKEV